MILLSDTVPWAGMVAGVVLYIVGLFFPPDAQERMIAWRDKPGAGRCCRRCCCGPRCRRWFVLLVTPLLMYRTFLEEDGAFNPLVRFLNRPGRKWPRGAQWLRFPIFVALSTYLGGIL